MDDNGNRLQKIARQEWLTGLSRMVQLIGIPAGLGFLGWLILQVAGIDANFAALNGKIDGAIEKIVSTSERVTRLEVWEDSLRRR